MMKTDTISLRRRHLMIAGLASVAAPQAAWAGPSGTLGSGGSLIVSGRMVRPDRGPLAGAMVEVWHEGAWERASAITDADGRFMFETVMPPQNMHYRVTHEGRGTPARQLHFAQPQRDEKGVWRATFGITLV